MNLTELAKSPLAFDTELARLHNELATAQDAKKGAMDRLHHGAGDHRDYDRHGSHWRKSNAEVMAIANQMMDEGVRGRMNIDMGEQAAKYYVAAELADSLLVQIVAMDEVYAEHRWTRFFPSVTKSQPHIHRSLSCRTLHPTTVMSWAPELSGHTDAEAVAKLDEALCSVCFPDAPVALHNYVSRKSQAERQARDEATIERMAAKAAKTLTTAEQFRTSGRFGETVTTVAKCKELVRKAVELEVELVYWTQALAGTRSVPNWTPELLARRVANLRDSASEAATDANRAKLVLMTREAEHQGWGATQAEITKMQLAKDKSARKEWGL